MRTRRWTAILTVISKSPANAEELRKNPLGLYVRAIDWSREFDTSSPGSQE
jgi:type IV secretion system protein VirB5